ncbi:MAG: PAS domain S-box protein, partial [Deltaproteobacteria bacterium]
MNTADKPEKELTEVEHLRFRLEEAQQTLYAIGKGEVDAFVVSGEDGDQVFALKGAETPYRILVETMNEGAATLSTDGTILYCNKRLASLLQIPIERVVGTLFVSYVSPTDRFLFKAWLEKCQLEDGSMEISLVTEAGSFVPILISCHAYDLSGNCGLSLVITDLTLQKHNEEIMATEGLARSIFEASSDAIGVSRKGVHVIVNPSYRQLFGLENLTDINKISVLELIAPSERERIKKYIALRAEGKPVPSMYETVGLKTNGNEFPMEVNVSTYRRDIDINTVVIIRDVTERKQTERNIQRLSNLYAALSACSQAMVHCKNEEELFQQICQATVQFGGMKLAWIGLVDTLSGLVKVAANSGSGNEYLNGIEISVNSDSPFGQGPTGIAIREKHPVWCQNFQVESITSPWHDRAKKYGLRASASLPLYRNGEAVGALTIYSGDTDFFDEDNRNLLVDMSRDISYALDNLAREIDRKKMEDERLALERQLLQAQKMESLGVLAGGIAHDFNNILAVIIGNCFLVKMDYETAETHIPEIEKSVERAAGLCRQMLAYAGKAQLTQAQVNIRILVDEMVDMLKATLPRNSAIKPDFTTGIPFILGDASQLRQIVMNLIINASEAIGENEGEILISLVKMKVGPDQYIKDHQGKDIPPGGYVCLEVTDNGCGMDEETKWRIFEPFYTTKFTGRGLGMSAVLGIIKAHNGALQLFSQLGKGTTFKV